MKLFPNTASGSDGRTCVHIQGFLRPNIPTAHQQAQPSVGEIESDPEKECFLIALLNGIN